MSNYSEKQLQQALDQAGYYTQKAPSSGHGILDPETGEYIDQADIVAIRKANFTFEFGDVPDAMRLNMGCPVPQVLVIEEKHYKTPTCPIRDEEKKTLERIRDITAGRCLFAVKWKHKHDDHLFFTLEDLIDTGKNWKITEEMNGMTLDDVLP